MDVVGDLIVVVDVERHNLQDRHMGMYRHPFWS
jgi:hypothetical protein